MKHSPSQNRYLSFRKAAQKVFLITLLLLNFICVQKAHAQILVSFTTTGDAIAESSDCYNLTPAAIDTCFNKVGAIWSGTNLDFTNPFIITFNATINPESGINSADGFVFAFGNNFTSTTPPNLDGGHLGYYDYVPGYESGTPNPTYANNSFGIEFDIFYDDATYFCDPPSGSFYDHVAIGANAVPCPTVAGPAPILAGGSTIADNVTRPYAISWDPSTTTLNVYEGTSCIPILSSVYDYRTIFTTGTATNIPWGVTGSTGSDCSEETLCDIFLYTNFTGTENLTSCGPATLPPPPPPPASFTSYLWSTGATTSSITVTASGTYTVTGYSSCGNKQEVYNVTVNPLPAAITGPSSVCVGSTITLADASSGTWSSSNTSVATVSVTGVVTGIMAGTTIIYYTLPVTGCSVSTIVTVDALPTSITGMTLICGIGSNTILNDAIAGGTWSSSNTSVATVISGGAGTGIVTSVSPGTSIITYTMPGGCFTTTEVTVDLGVAAITGPGIVCAGSTINLADATTGGIWSSSNTGIATVSSSGLVNGISAGDAVISYTLPGGCYAITTVTVYEMPANITGGTLICGIGNNTVLYDGVGGGTWSSSNTYVATVVSYTSGTCFVIGVSYGTSIITYTMPGGCFATTEVTVAIAAGPITGPDIVCIGSPVVFTDAVAGGAWSSSNTLIATVTSSGLVTGYSTGSVYIIYTMPDGCYTADEIFVAPPPDIITGGTTVCQGATITLADASAGGSWSSSNTSIATVVSATGVVTGVSAGTATISYINGYGCFVTTTVTVYASPTPIAGVTTVCVGATTSLSDNITGGVWSSSNTGIATIDPSLGTVTGVSTGTTIITYMLPGGCFVTTIVTVITTPPAPTITPLDPDVYTGCTITLTGSPGIGGADDITSVLWAEVDGTGTATLSSYTTAVTTLTGGTPGTVTVSYTATNSCGSATATTNVTVLAQPVITISSDPPPTDFELCVGASGVATASPAGGTWSSGNTGIATVAGSSPAVVTGVSAGITALTYTLTLDGGCTETAILPVTINPNPAIIMGIMELCVGEMTTLNDATGGGVWSSDDIYVATVGAGTGVVTGIATGIADISYTLATGCFIVATVTVNNAAISGTPMLCVGNSATFTDAIAGGTWSSTNTTVATVTSGGVVTGVGVGTAVISYLSTAGCAGTFTVTVIDVTSACVCEYVSLGGIVTELDPMGTGVLAPGVYAAGAYYLTHNVVINGNVQFIDAVVDMASGISMTVNSGGYLTVEGSHLYCCNPNMWQGITLSTTLSTGGTGPTGQLEMDADPNGITSMIEDAQVAIKISSPVHMAGYVPGTASLLTLYMHGGVLNRNTTGVSITGDASTTAPVSGDPLVLNPSYPYVIENTVITSRNFYGYTATIGGLTYPWPLVWPSTSLLKTPITPLTPYQPPYNINTAFTYTVCNSGTAPQKAIDIENTGYTNPGSGAGTEIYSGVVIGGASTGILATDMNLMDKYVYGIYDVNSNVVSRNTAFMNIAPTGTAGNAIYADRTGAAAVVGKLYKLDVFGTNPGTTAAQYLAGYNNKFWSNYVHVYAYDLYNVRGIYSLMNGLSNVKTQYGYEISSSQYYDIKLDYNMMFNLLYGISHITMPPVSGAVQLLGETSMSYNSISDVNPAGGPHTYGEYVSKALSMQNSLSVSAGTVTGSQVNLDYNTITNVYNGIYLSGSNQGQLTTTDYNTVSLRQDVSGPALQVGIEHVNTIDDFIDENTVTGPGYNTPVPTGNYGTTPIIEGIHVATTQKQWTECNTVEKINTGFYFGGTNHSLFWIGNTMNTNHYGYVLDGIIGYQPTTYGAATTGNQWLPSGFWTGTNWQTYTVGSTTPIPSTMWVNSAYATTQVPTHNSFDVGGFAAYAISAGINPTVNPATPCSAPSAGTVPEVVVHIMGAQKQIPFVDNIGPKDWIAQMATYQATTTDTVIDTSVLQAFNAMATTRSRYQGINTIETTLAAANYPAAQSLVSIGLDSMANTDSDVVTGAVMADGPAANSVVNNYKQYYYLLIKCQTDTLSASDSAGLVALANMCPYVDGSIIYNARALYSFVFNDLSMFADADCDPNAGSDARHANTDSTTSPSLSTGAGLQQYKLFPNPNDGNLTLIQLIADTQPVNIEVLNATGVSVYNITLSFENAGTQLNIPDKVPGLYLIHLTDSKGRKFMLKFVIE